MKNRPGILHHILAAIHSDGVGIAPLPTVARGSVVLYRSDVGIAGEWRIENGEWRIKGARRTGIVLWSVGVAAPFNVKKDAPWGTLRK